VTGPAEKGNDKIDNDNITKKGGSADDGASFKLKLQGRQTACTSEVPQPSGLDDGVTEVLSSTSHQPDEYE